MSESWQECECPKCGIDFDLHGAEMAQPGQTVGCIHCGHEAPAEAMVANAYDGNGNLVPWP